CLDPERVVPGITRWSGAEDGEGLPLRSPRVAFRQPKLRFREALGGARLLVRSLANALDQPARPVDHEAVAVRVAHGARPLEGGVVVAQLVLDLGAQDVGDRGGPLALREGVRRSGEPVQRAAEVAGSTSNPPDVEARASRPDGVGLAIEERSGERRRPVGVAIRGGCTEVQVECEIRELGASSGLGQPGQTAERSRRRDELWRGRGGGGAGGARGCAWASRAAAITSTAPQRADRCRMTALTGYHA